MHFLLSSACCMYQPYHHFDLVILRVLEAEHKLKITCALSTTFLPTFLVSSFYCMLAMFRRTSGLFLGSFEGNIYHLFQQYNLSVCCPNDTPTTTTTTTTTPKPGVFLCISVVLWLRRRQLVLGSSLQRPDISPAAAGCLVDNVELEEFCYSYFGF